MLIPLASPAHLYLWLVPPSQHLLCSPLKADGCHMGRASPYLEDRQERCQSARKHVICIKMQGRIRRWGWGLEVGGAEERGWGVNCNRLHLFILTAQQLMIQTHGTPHGSVALRRPAALDG